MLGRGGRDTEIVHDTTWTNDRIYAVRHQVFVNAGATLTIEPGTLILGHGPQAAIVVERGGRIAALGRPDAPIVMTCDEPLGQRFEGCWGGLVVLGSAPTGRGMGLAADIAPPQRPIYGGDQPLDSSGVLRYVRVEFAGAGTGADPVGLGLYGVGSGTLVDHVQVHASAGDGILFSGGTAACRYCTVSGARDDALVWDLGWRGTAQHLFLQLGPAGGDCAIEGKNDEMAFDALPRSAPKLYNLTAVGGAAQAASASSAAGIVLRSGSAVTVRNAIVMGFSAGAIHARDNSPSLFMDGTSSIHNLIVYANGSQSASAEINGGIEDIVGYQEVDPLLINVGYQASPDPRPQSASPTLLVGAGAAPPLDEILDTNAQHVGAFDGSNWLDEWTFFGPEADYDTREEPDEADER